MKPNYTAQILICVLLVIATVGGASAQKLARPRLLIGENDPFTGLTILRARYANGMRPTDDIAGWSLSYLLTKDESFANRALDEMRRTHPPEKVGSRT